jgi:hypothetical protein
MAPSCFTMPTGVTASALRLAVGTSTAASETVLSRLLASTRSRESGAGSGSWPTIVAGMPASRRAASSSFHVRFTWSCGSTSDGVPAGGCMALF